MADSEVVEEPWRFAERRTAEFDAAALDYDRFRPRYPERLFDDIVDLAGLRAGARGVEIGAGTGIATGPLIERGIDLIPVEPSPAMAAVGRRRLGDQARWFVGRFEDLELEEPVDLVVACNSWHWVEPAIGLERAAAALRPGGSIALVWTPVVRWGSDDFERGLTEAFGAPWPKTLEVVLESRRPVELVERFGALVECL